MRKVVLYIAVSIDGYIADSKGSVDWLGGHDKNGEMKDTFTPFFRTVDTVIMGRRTYEQVVNELSPHQWPYQDAVTYVLTHTSVAATSQNILFKNMEVCQLLEELKRKKGKNIWICGGATIVRNLVAQNMIDIYHLAIVPVVLGGGIRLFGGVSPKIDLALADIQNYNGIVEVVYRKRSN